MKLKILYIDLLLWSYYLFGFIVFGLFYFYNDFYEKYFNLDTNFLMLFVISFSLFDGIFDSIKSELKENEIILNNFNKYFYFFIISTPIIAFILSFFEKKYDLVFLMFIFSILFLIRIIYSNILLKRKQKNDLIKISLRNIEYSLTYLKQEDSKEVKEKIYNDIEEYLKNISKNAS
jgi:hypothetical protein